MEKNVMVLDAPAATDINLNNGNLVIVGTMAPNQTSVTLNIPLKDIVPMQNVYLPYVIETLQKSTFSVPTTAAGTDYAVNISQWNPTLGKFMGGVIKVRADSNFSSSALVSSAMADQINAITNAGALQITATAASGACTLTAKAGYPVFSIVNAGNCTVTANALASATLSQTAGTAVASSAGLVTLSLSTGTWDASIVAGSVVSLTKAGAAAISTLKIYRNGVDQGTTNLTFNVSTTSTTALTVRPSLYGDDGTNGVAAGVVQLQPSYVRGNTAEVIARGYTATLAGTKYSQFYVEYYTLGSDIVGNSQKVHNSLYVYINEGAANYATLLVNMWKAFSGSTSALNTMTPSNFANQTANADAGAIAM